MRRLAIFAALVLGGCSHGVATFWEQGDIRARWNEQNIYPQNYKSDLLAFLRTYLNDPSHLRDTALAPPQLKNLGPGDRYVVCVRYNERKSNGQYGGARDGAAIYVSGKLDSFRDGGKNLEGSKIVKEICNDAAFAPFPELATLAR
jgi:hypothetical protein